MNKTSYTPGPWRVATKETEYIVEDQNGIQIRLCRDGWGCANGEGEANALLIAAAPKLYEELFRALSVIRSPQSYEIEQVCSDIERVLEEAVKR